MGKRNQVQVLEIPKRKQKPLNLQTCEYYCWHQKLTLLPRLRLHMGQGKNYEAIPQLWVH